MIVYIGRLSFIFQRIADTTMITLASYYDSVNIKESGFSVATGVFSDFGRVLSLIVFAYLFFN